MIFFYFGEFIELTIILSSNSVLYVERKNIKNFPNNEKSEAENYFETVKVGFINSTICEKFLSKLF